MKKGNETGTCSGANPDGARVCVFSRDANKLPRKINK